MSLNLHSSRRGLSLMEVLFAIGVLMVGILGIAAVLPVGTKNAASALRTDASTSSVENQVSNALARFGGRPESVVIPVPSQNGFAGTGSNPNVGVLLGGLWQNNAALDPVRPTAQQQRYNTASTLIARNAFPNIDPATGLPAPSAAVAFCIDPAFLAAASNLRPDAGNVNSRTVNHYDRTKFPCYDINYDPTIAPGLQMNTASAWPVTPRMLRVSVSSETTSAPTDAVANVLLSERDGLPLTKTKDKTQSPSLFFSELGVGRVDREKSGAYSSMVTFTPTSASGTNYDVSVVVYESRQLTMFDTTMLTSGFQLSPFTAAANSIVWPLGNNTNIVPPTYGEEVMGVVTATSGLIEDGVGAFTFVQSNRCNPEVKVGQWLMLTRFDEPLGINCYAWYRISAVLTAPYVVGDTYVAEVEVRGQDWLYFPLPIPPVNVPLVVVYPNPVTSPAARRHATYVIKCPNVVSVRKLAF